MNISCTICSDLINQAESLFVTKCGHLFHHQCLVQWIERSRSCPQCRNKVTEKCMFRVFPTICEANGESAPALQARLDDAQLQLRQRDATERQLRDRIDTLTTELEQERERAKAGDRRAATGEAAAATLREQLRGARALAADADALRLDNERLRERLDLLHGLQRVLSAAAEDADEMLAAYSDVRTVATFATALKRALCDSENKKTESRDEVRALRSQLAVERKRTVRLRMALRRGTSTPAATGNADRANSTLNRVDELPASASPTHPDLSLNSMVNKIQAAESPYLDLQHGSVALTLLPRRPCPPADPLRPAAFPLEKFSHQNVLRPTTPSGLDTSYDGLGGRSRPDEFPTARGMRSGRTGRANVRRRLARPTVGTDIGRLLQRLGAGIATTLDTP